MRWLSLLLIFLTSPAFSAGHGHDYRYNRLLFQVDSSETGGYRFLCFSTATQAKNYFGTNDVNGTLATEYFAGWTAGLRPNYCTGRMPIDLIGRAHLMGADRSHSLAAIKAASGNFDLIMNGFDYNGCLGTAAGCTDLSGDATFAAVAADLETAINANQQAPGWVNASATNQSITLTGTTYDSSTINITAPSGTVYPGMYICLTTNPCDNTAGDFVGQILGYVPYYCANVPCTNGGVGTYTIFVPSTPRYPTPTSMVASYTQLTVNTGGGLIAVGAKVRGSNMHTNSVLFYCISGCTNTKGNQAPTAGSVWLVPYQPTGAVSNAFLTVSAPNVEVSWNAVTGVNYNWGYFFLGIFGGDTPFNSSFGYMTGPVADTLGLAQSSVGDGTYDAGTTPAYAIFNSSPPPDAAYPEWPSIAAFVNNFNATINHAYRSCSETTTPSFQPPNANVLLETWGIATPPYECPSTWVTNPASTPAALSYSPSLVPAVGSLSPTSGLTAGGTSVTISGVSFNGATAVNFGATPATFSFVNDTTITVGSTPAHSASIVDVSVVTPRGTSAANPPADQFTYTGVVPAVSSVLPNNGGLAGGTVVDVLGSGFVGTPIVKFGTTSATSITVLSSSHLQATAPAGTSTRDITVATTGGTSPTTSADQFTYHDWTLAWQADSASPDPFGNFLGGTEQRSIITHWTPVGGIIPGTNKLSTCSSGSPSYNPVKGQCGSLLSGNGYWFDTACNPTHPTPDLHPQIIALSQQGGTWAQDGVLPGGCGTPSLVPGGHPSGSFFDVTNSLFEMVFSISSTGATISPPIDLAVASGSARSNIGSAVDSTPFVRDETTGNWNPAVIPGGVVGSNRSMTSHIDNAVSGGPLQYLLIGNDTGTPYHGTYNTSTRNLVMSGTPEPWGACGTDPDTCTNQATDWVVTMATGQHNTISSITSDGANPSTITVTWNNALYAAPTAYTTTVTGFAVGAGGAGATNANVTAAAIIKAGTTKTVLKYKATGVVTCGAGCTASAPTLKLNPPLYSPSCPNTNGTPPGLVGQPSVIECQMNVRINAMADCGGTVYAVERMELWQRTDGNSPQWTLNSVTPIPTAGLNSASGERGLTCVPYNGGWRLLMVTEGQGVVWRVDPSVGAGAGDSAGWTQEVNLTHFGYSGTYGIHAYNEMTLVNNSVVFGGGTTFAPVATHPYFYAPSGHIEDIAVLWTRSKTTDLAPTYTLNPTYPTQYNAMLSKVRPVFSQTVGPDGTVGGPGVVPTCPAPSGGKCQGMLATRGTAVSPFPQDADANGNPQVLYFCGPDAQITPMHDSAWILNVPFSTIGGIP